MVVSKLITSLFWLTLLLPRPWALCVSACEACSGMRYHHAESAQHYGDAAAWDPSSSTPRRGEGEWTHSGNGWRLDYGIAGMAKGWDWEGLPHLSVLQGGMSLRWPPAGWSCVFGPQAASFHKSNVGFLAALPKWFKTSETLMAGSRAWGFGALGELNLKAASAQCPLHHWGLLHRCSGMLTGTQDAHSSWSAGVLVGLCRKCLVARVPEC